MNETYEASIIAVSFDEKYEFEDILHLGIAHSKTEALSIQQDEIMRLYEDFTDENQNHVPIEYSEGRSQYDEPICVIKYAAGYEHIYCLFNKKKEDEE